MPPGARDLPPLRIPAIVRYLERHYGVDVKAILEEMISPENAPSSPVS